MAEITVNGLQNNYEGMIMLSDVPNIVAYENASSGSKAKLEITFTQNRYQPPVKGQTITINGETISSVSEITECNGRHFYIGQFDLGWTCSTMAQALNNCPTIAANYNIWATDTKVIIEAKTDGSKYNLTVEDELTSLTMYTTKNDGTSTDDLKNEIFAKVSIQIFKQEVDKYNGTKQDAEYIATLSKTYYDDKVSFDISPIISTFSKYGQLTAFRFDVYLMSSNIQNPYSKIISVENMYVINGYRSNLSTPYIYSDNIPQLMQWVDNGTDWMNKYTLYLYKPEIDLSWVGFDAPVFQINYLDSTFKSFHTETYSRSNYKTIDIHVDVSGDYFMEAFYISVTLPSINSVNGKLLYTVVKGLKATSECTRIYWRNEFGGISFFDFTGAHDKELTFGGNTYECSDLGYYDTNER